MQLLGSPSAQDQKTELEGARSHLHQCGRPPPSAHSVSIYPMPGQPRSSCMGTRSPSAEERSMSRQKGTSQRSGSLRNTECLPCSPCLGFHLSAPSFLPLQAHPPLVLPASLLCSHCRLLLALPVSMRELLARRREHIQRQCSAQAWVRQGSGSVSQIPPNSVLLQVTLSPWG